MSVRYYKRLKVYKNQSGSNVIDLEGMNAYSYNHWKYLTVFNGITIFNDAFYSVTTRRHQLDLRHLLDKKPDIVLKYSKISLHTPIAALEDEVVLMALEVDALMVKIANPKSRKETNIRRNEMIDKHNIEIVKLNRFISGMHNKAA